MLLCKIMTDAAEEVPLMLDGKLALKYAGEDLDVMRDIAKAYQSRSLDKLITAQAKYKEQVCALFYNCKGLFFQAFSCEKAPLMS